MANGNITKPILKIKSRLHFHAETGYTPPGGSLTKILDGLKIYDSPSARNQEQKDLPNLVMDVPDLIGFVEPHNAAYGECDIVLELSVAKESEVIGDQGKSLLEWAEKIVTALLRDESGNPDHHLDGTVAKQIVISATDGISSEVSLTMPITVKWRTKAYR